MAKNKYFISFKLIYTTKIMGFLETGALEKNLIWATSLNESAPKFLEQMKKHITDLESPSFTIDSQVLIYNYKKMHGK